MLLNSWEYDLLIFQLNWDLHLPKKSKQAVRQFTGDLPKTRPMFHSYLLHYNAMIQNDDTWRHWLTDLLSDLLFLELKKWIEQPKVDWYLVFTI